MLTSKERKTTIFFFFYRKIYVEMFRSQILLNLICIIRRKNQCKYFIKITPMEHRIENIRTMSKLSTWKTTHKNINSGNTECISHSYTIYSFILFFDKCKTWFFGGYVKQITEIIFRDVRGILIGIVLFVSTIINSLF